MAAPFAGWDWSWLEGRRTVAYAPYDLAPLYAERARALVAAASAVLDLGTGGGEQLSQYGPFSPREVARILVPDGKLLTRNGRTEWRSPPDIGAVVYSPLHVPWSVPGFGPERYRARLYQLHQRMQQEGGFSTTSSGDLVEAVVSRL